LIYGRYFTWDQHLFPDPVKLQEDIASHGRKTVTIIDPHIKRDPNYYIYQEAERNSYFVRDKDGKDFDGCEVGMGGAKPSACVAAAAPGEERGDAAGGVGPGHRLIWICWIPL
jgi:hypothetical protein